MTNNDQMKANKLSKEGNVGQNKSNYAQKESNQSSGVGIDNIESFVFHNEPLNKNAASKESVAPTTSPVNTTTFLQPLSFEKLGTIITAASQPAARLTNKSEITDLNAGLIDSTLPTLAKDESNVNDFTAALKEAILEDVKMNWWVVN